MIKYLADNKFALIVLHEIYGVNEFIDCVCRKYHSEGYDVFCPDLNDGKTFGYSESREAYTSFVSGAGFEIYTKVNLLIDELKTQYQKVMLIGFSVGAAIAWRCSENMSCGGVLCCYGSRIRDYLDVIPKCPVLLIFAKYDSFDVDSVCSHLLIKADVKVKILEAEHGFADIFSKHYCAEQSDVLNSYRTTFLNGLIKRT